MKNVEKYTRQYFMPPKYTMDWASKEYIEKAPRWCSVDLRDGNQALIIPMSLSQKLEFFQLLLELGFKEIEVGFPAASETEYEFLRTIIEKNMIPDDVTVQVLTQAREHIIKKTFQAVKGAKNVVIHLYNSTSLAQREQVFQKSCDEIKDIAIKGAELLVKLTEEMLREEPDMNITYEYSPESFTGTEIDYALEVCNAVLDVFFSKRQEEVIINLPATVELSLPHVYATQIEYMSKNLKYRDKVVLSVHTHNDRGCAVADTELALLAGADRVEGTLFGNGERTGNVDLVTLAMNLYMHGVKPNLNLTNMPKIVEIYESCTQMSLNERSPYSGKLVFAAFSGSHQDAIAKGMKLVSEGINKYWTVPYLTIDPKDVSRTYETDVIRINSQSGKGGVGYILEHNFGLRLPKAMSEAMGYIAKDYSDRLHKELEPVEIFDLFKENFENINKPYSILKYSFTNEDGIVATVTSSDGNETKVTSSTGNGRLNAISNALKKAYGFKYNLSIYEEHALEHSSSSRAMAYVGIKSEEGKLFFGAGLDTDIITASIDALLTAINNLYK